MVIPLDGAAGKTFESADKRVIVTSVETSQVDGPGRPSEQFDLTFDNLNDLIPQEPDTTQNRMQSMRMAMGPGMGMGPGMSGGRAGLAGGYGVLQKLVQVISTKGRRYPAGRRLTRGPDD